MTRVVGIDHLSIRVSDYEKSKLFYGRLLTFLGFKVEADYPEATGWSNGHTLFWIGQAEPRAGKRRYQLGEVGLHHYAFRLRSREDVDDLDAFLRNDLKAEIVDPAGEYYEDYYAVFFLDPDGLKLEGTRYGENGEKSARKAS